MDWRIHLASKKLLYSELVSYMDLTNDTDNPHPIHGLITPDLRKRDALPSVFFILLMIMLSAESIGSRSCYN